MKIHIGQHLVIRLANGRYAAYYQSAFPRDTFPTYRQAAEAARKPASH